MAKFPHPPASPADISLATPDRPGDAPAGGPEAQPRLPAPSPEALRRAAPLFAQLLGLGPHPAARTAQEASREEAAPNQPPPRQYPVAARLLHRATGAPPPTQVPDAAPMAPAEVATEAAAPWRPKQGFVRSSVPGPKASVVPQVLLEEVAQTALVTEAQNEVGPSFTIQFREELLGALQCRLQVHAQGHVVATFEAPDDNTRRLLHSEAGRLRDALEAQGLRRVVIEVQKPQEEG